MELSHPKLVRVLFDEAHSEAWTIRPEVARAIQPAHPEDSSLVRAAAALERCEFEASVNASAPLDEATLASADVLVIAHPSEPKWEATVGEGSPRFGSGELDAIEAFVRAGGGLLVLAESEQDKYGNNVDDLLARFGIAVANATVQDYEHHHARTPSWVLAWLQGGDDPEGGVDLLAGVEAACFYRAGTLRSDNGARAIARTHDSSTEPGAALALVSEQGEGRVAVLSDSDLFGDDCIGELDHERLWLNLVHWTAAPAFAQPAEVADSGTARDPAWARLRAAVAELRLAQEPDGSIRSGGDRTGIGELTEEIATAAGDLVPRFPHQAAYIEALQSDLRAWAAAGFGKPDFIGSVRAFRPELERRDGVEHLVVFPMYKQNASREVCFEALIVRVPWPEWVAALERRYDNAKYLPVTLVDYTDGYDSECAVLFPETFATAGPPEAYFFGAIFCDREAERLRRVAGSAARILRLNLPPDAAAMLSSEQLSRDAYILWDLIHDRTHMRGDLPFDPFMIRQRSPYWMYALEELRCDLTAFAEAAKLEQEGFAFARHAQSAIVLDRLFRFPLTGSRVRNYDGLGGQLLFAYLHREGYLHWTDNRMRIEWPRLVEGVAGLRERVQDLYHSGIDRSKVSQWIAAHDLVSSYVPAAERSVWAAARRDLPEVEEPKQLVDLVRDDEFPLSLFYSQLQPKLESSLVRPSRANAS